MKRPKGISIQKESKLYSFPMDIAIIGGGISGSLLAKKLLSPTVNNINSVSIYEKAKRTSGLFSTHFSPDSDIKPSVVALPPQCKVINKEVRPCNFNPIIKKYDRVILALGGVERKLEGAQPASESIKAYKEGRCEDFKGKSISIIGSGNVALDLVRNLLKCGANKIYIIGRGNLGESKFTPIELYKTLKGRNFSVFNNSENTSTSRIVRRKYDLFKEGSTNSESSVNFIFNSPIKSIVGNTLHLKDRSIKCDRIISAIGFEDNPLTNKLEQIYKNMRPNTPLYKVGWAALGRGTVSDVWQNVQTVFKQIINETKG